MKVCFTFICRSHMSRVVATVFSTAVLVGLLLKRSSQSDHQTCWSGMGVGQDVKHLTYHSMGPVAGRI